MLHSVQINDKCIIKVYTDSPLYNKCEDPMGRLQITCILYFVQKAKTQDIEGEQKRANNFKTQWSETQK